MPPIDHHDIITGKPQSSRMLRLQRWPFSLLRLVNWLEARLSRQRARKQLRELNDHMLKDIGLTRREADMEGRKGFFD